MKWVVRTPSGDREFEVERRPDGLFRVLHDGRERIVDLVRLNGSLTSMRCTEDDRSWKVLAHRDGRRWRVGLWRGDVELEVLSPAEAVEAGSVAARSGSATVTAPIPGKVVAVKVSEGDTVEPGQPLVVLEAMKMENELVAERAGTVRSVHVEAGETVDTGAALVEIGE